MEVKRKYTTANSGRPKTVTVRKKVKKTGSKMQPRSDISCTELGGICQPNRYICRGRYLRDRCSRAKTRQCCTPGTVTQVTTVDAEALRIKWEQCDFSAEPFSKSDLNDFLLEKKYFRRFSFLDFFLLNFFSLDFTHEKNPQTQEKKNTQQVRKKKWFSRHSSSTDLPNGDLKSY